LLTVGVEAPGDRARGMKTFQLKYSPTKAWGEDLGAKELSAVNNLNINLDSVSVATGIDVLVTGQQLTVDLNSVTL
jgi:hypothetical protein